MVHNDDSFAHFIEQIDVASSQNLRLHKEQPENVRRDIYHEKVEELVDEPTDALNNSLRVNLFLVDELVGEKDDQLAGQHADAAGPEVVEEQHEVHRIVDH